MKKALAWLLVLAMTAALAVGGTLAYLTDTDEDVNVMTVGQVKIDQLEYERVDVDTENDDADVQEFHDNKPLYPAVTEDGFDYTPGDSYVDWEQIGKDGYTSEIWDPSKINNEQDKMVFVKNKGDWDAYVRSVFAFEAGSYTSLEEYLKDVHLNLNQSEWTWEWAQAPVEIGGGNYFVAVATYNKVLEPGKLTEISLSQIALDSSVTNEEIQGFGDTFQVLVQSQAVQAAGFEDADTALNEAFGEIVFTDDTQTPPTTVVDPDDEDFPFVDDNPTKGIDIRTALHYLEGDTTTNAITANVATVTFGLNKDHEAIVNGNTGTLVDVEQDVPVYAYYVKNGDNYDVYFLADDDIYLPTDSNSLMMDMTALTAVNTGNLNTSRTENMQKLFRKCSSLTTLDTTDWDTSKVTNMAQVFYQCSALQNVPGLEDWDTGATTSMRGMFRQAGVAGDLDLTGWDVSNVTDMYQMFYKCPNLVNLNAEGWDAGACTDMGYMFFVLPKLESVNAAGWDTSSVTNMYAMFYESGKMKTLNATGWDTSNVTDATCMFTRCRAFENFIGSGGLNFGKVANMGSMCEGWDSMPYLDATNWNCGSATNMGNLFAWGLSLETVEGIENWDVSNVTSMSAMFYACYDLKELNVTGWDVSKVDTFGNMFASEHQNWGDMKLEKLIGTETWNPTSATKMSSMFYGCGHLTDLDLSGWNVPKLTHCSHMFADCYNLVNLDLSGWQTPSLKIMDAMFNNCESMTFVDMSSFDTSNVTEFSQLFESCYSLKEIKGLENWNTAKGASFSEMFSGCTSLKELNLSSFNTRGADENYRYHYTHTVDYSEGYERMFSNLTALEKLTVSADFSFDGDGKVTTESYKMKLPAPAAKEGFTAKWRNVETGELYLATEIPEEVAATYEAYYEAI